MLFFYLEEFFNIYIDVMYIDMREISKLGNARMKGTVKSGKVPPFFLLVGHVRAGVERSEGGFPVPLLVVCLVVALVVVIHPDSATGDNVVSSSQPSVYSLLFHEIYYFLENNHRLDVQKNFTLYQHT